MNIYGLHKKADLSMCTTYAQKFFTKHDSRNTQVSMFLKKYKMAINLAGMLLVACKRHMLLLVTLKS